MNNKKQILVASIFAGLILLFLIGITILKFTTSTLVTEDSGKVLENAETQIVNAANKLKSLDNFKIINTISYQLNTDFTNQSDNNMEGIINAIPNNMTYEIDIDLKNNLSKTTFESEIFGIKVNSTVYQDYNSKMNYTLDNTTSKWSKEAATAENEMFDIDAIKDLVLPNKNYTEITTNMYQTELTEEEYLKFSDMEKDVEQTGSFVSATLTYSINDGYLSEFRLTSISSEGSSTSSMGFSGYNTIGDIVIPSEAYNAK